MPKVTPNMYVFVNGRGRPILCENVISNGSQVYLILDFFRVGALVKDTTCPTISVESVLCAQTT